MGNSICTASEYPDENTKEKATPICFGKKGKVLASGIDTVVMSLSIIWKNNDFFKMLERLKVDAMAQGVPMPGVIEAGPHRWVFNVNAYGDGGYAWVLDSGDYHVQILNSLSPIARPSALIAIRSVTLWQAAVGQLSAKTLTKLLLTTPARRYIPPESSFGGFDEECRLIAKAKFR